MTGDTIAVVRTIAELRAIVSGWRAARQRVGLVPTMGAIHRGHLALVAAALEQCDHVVASLFVNPTQFGPSEDFTAYPRNEEADVAAFASAGVAVVFAPAGSGAASRFAQKRVQPSESGRSWASVDWPAETTAIRAADRL